MPGKYSHLTDKGRCIWYTDRLWELCRELPVRPVPIDSVTEFDQNCWFDAESLPTCRAVARHARRIFDADLSFPIILAADGRLMDGGHRLARAWLMGRTEILAVQFAEDPVPDEIRPLENSIGPGEYG